MCLEDIRIQRKSTSSERTVLVPNASITLVSPSADRTFLMISTPNTNDIFITTNPPASSTNGMRLQVGQSPLILTLLQHGDIVTKGWYAISPTADETVTVFETSFVDNER